MTKNPLKIIASDNAKPTAPRPSTQSARIEMQAAIERLWVTDSQQFDPLRNSMEKDRLAQTAQLIEGLPVPRKCAVDLGCGMGHISRMLRDKGWEVYAIDIAANALKAFRAKDCRDITLMQDALPCTKLEDDAFELVVCTEVIAYLPEKDYRLFMAELCRLVKNDGLVVCSTPIDINSEDALQRFGGLAETEFQIEQWHLRHHLLLLRLKHFFEYPQKMAAYIAGTGNRQQELNHRAGISKMWFKAATSKAMACIWYPLKWLWTPVVSLLRDNRVLLKTLEGICRAFWDTNGISHATFVARRRPLIPPTQAELASVEPKGKRQVWE